MDLRKSRFAAWGLLLMMGQSTSSQVPAAEVKPPVAVTLSAEVALKPAELIVTYRVSNETGVPIILWDQMIGYDGQGEKLDPDGAYVFWEQPDGIRLVRAQLQLPPGMDVYRKEIPYARTVAPHATVEGVVRLPLPLQETSPFFSPPEFWNVVHCERAHIVIGWRELLPEMKLIPVALRGGKAETVQGHWKGPLQHLLETTVNLSTRLKTRSDDFDRSMPMN